MGPVELLAAAGLALVVAAVTTPAGVSGATFLLPVQVSVLGVPNPALTPTNLLYNVVATPGALVRFAREGRLRSPLTARLLAGSVPGVVVGAALRVTVLDDAQAFLLVVAAVLAPVGASLLLGTPRRAPAPAAEDARRWLTPVAFGIGVVGGLYGIGGGSLVGPVLSLLGFSIATVAPAALTCTWVTSIAGVATFALLQATNGSAAIAPEWLLGLSLGCGGIAGTYLGARLQPRVPEHLLRRGLGALSVLLAVRYALGGLGVL